MTAGVACMDGLPLHWCSDPQKPLPESGQKSANAPLPLAPGQLYTPLPPLIRIPRKAHTLPAICATTCALLWLPRRSYASRLSQKMAHQTTIRLLQL